MSNLIIDGQTPYFCSRTQNVCVLEARLQSEKDLIVATYFDDYQNDDLVDDENATSILYLWLTTEDELEPIQ